MSIEDSHQTPHAPPYSSNISKSDLLSALVRRYASDQEDPHVDEETWISGSNLSKFISSFSAASGVCWMSKDCFEEYERFAAQHPNLELTLSKVADMLCELQKVLTRLNRLTKICLTCHISKPMSISRLTLSESSGACRVSQYFRHDINPTYTSPLRRLTHDDVFLVEKHTQTKILPLQFDSPHIKPSCQTATCSKSISRLKNIVRIHHQSRGKLQRKNEFLALRLVARENVISELQDLIRKLALNRNTQPDQCTITDSGSPGQQKLNIFNASTKAPYLNRISSLFSTSPYLNKISSLFSIFYTIHFKLYYPKPSSHNKSQSNQFKFAKIHQYNNFAPSVYGLSGYKYQVTPLLFIGIIKFISSSLMITIVEILCDELWSLRLKSFTVPVSHPSQPPACSNAMIYLDYLSRYRQLSPSQVFCQQAGFRQGF
ncbi:hypothetical protein PSTT_08820 [Puccinia striiformis]|uniref:Uncharacterized protein n=1 Tax=Puccinia striiformis TaxID=27350 RepID=A0A2S4VAV6_9BASI|nr:hypothetical protein PSTT_08820 [Puccinia striiformis]